MVKIRKASLEDCKDIFLWRNDPKTRESSFNAAIIPYEKHLKWYQQALCDDRKIIFIGEDFGGSKIGMIRFDRIGSNAYEVNVNLATEHRGRGLGSQLITQASQLVKGKILAKIKADNMVSTRVFRKSRYVETRNEDGVIYMEYINQ